MQKHPAQRSDRIWRVVLVVLLVVLFVVSGVRVVEKARRGSGALNRWGQVQTEGVLQGRMIYEHETNPQEGFPCPPVVALAIRGLYVLGPVGASVVLFMVKFAVTCWILHVVVAFCRVTYDDWPGWATCLLLLLSARVFMGDFTHMNINLLVAGLIVGALDLSRRRRDGWAGLLIGAAAVVKVTPALFVVYFLYKRRWKAVLGAMAAVVLLVAIVPSVFLGVQRNAELTGAWFDQMIVPFAEGKVTHAQTSSNNQSIPSLLHRMLSHKEAVYDYEGGNHVYFNKLSLDTETVLWISRAVAALILATIAFAARAPDADRGNIAMLGEFAIVFMAMLLLSERSWKHHYVLIILSHALIFTYLMRTQPRDTSWKLVFGLAACSLVFHWLLNETTVGKANKQALEAHGPYVLGGICLFVADAIVLWRLRCSNWVLGVRGDVRGS